MHIHSRVRKERTDYRFLMLAARSLVVIEVERKKLLEKKHEEKKEFGTTHLSCRSLARSLNKIPLLLFAALVSSRSKKLLELKHVIHGTTICFP